MAVYSQLLEELKEDDAKLDNIINFQVVNKTDNMPLGLINIDHLLIKIF